MKEREIGPSPPGNFSAAGEERGGGEEEEDGGRQGEEKGGLENRNRILHE